MKDKKITEHQWIVGQPQADHSLSMYNLQGGGENGGMCYGWW